MTFRITTKHKFIDELEYYEDNPIVGDYNILVIGTFNPKIEKNNANWFYGRSASEFWYLFPKSLGFDSFYPSDMGLKIEDVHKNQKEFCEKNKIIIVDIFKEIMSDVKGYRDNEFHSLNKEDYKMLDFKKAFSKCNFKVVVFTWKSNIKSQTQNKIREEVMAFFRIKGTPSILLDSPSPSHQIGRYDKLKEWEKQFMPYLNNKVFNFYNKDKV